jgi:ABC-type nitrate/sulfonate/bicarbonate transport system ATPase subunit
MTYRLANTLLKLENISLKFGEKQVLSDVNLEVKNIVDESACKGQVITLLGRSGVGKTQLMKIIAGLLKPSTGNVLIGLEQKPVEPGTVGMVLQNYPLFQHRTLLGNLQLVSSDKEKIETFLNDFDLVEHKDKYPSQMSGGQRQRTAIVQQLLCSEHFILLDEPFSGLDPVAIEKLCKNITKVANRDDANTVLISTHILEPSLAISDSIIMLGTNCATSTPVIGGIEPEGPIVDVNQTFKKMIIKTGENKMVERGWGEKIPGATIKYYYDLAANGLAWNPEIRKDPRFTELVEQIRTIFQTL